MAIHSFSPRANQEVLTAYAQALNGASNKGLRLRLEHTGVITDAEVQEMARLGSLKPGKYADLVILSGNPLTTAVEQIPDIKVLMTMVAGQPGYCTADQHAICIGATP